MYNTMILIYNTICERLKWSHNFHSNWCVILAKYLYQTTNEICVILYSFSHKWPSCSAKIIIIIHRMLYGDKKIIMIPTLNFMIFELNSYHTWILKPQKLGSRKKKTMSMSNISTIFNNSGPFEFFDEIICGKSIF